MSFRRPSKASGVTWIGDVPTDWDVCALGYRYEVQLGRMLNAERASGDNLRPYLRVFDVQWGQINIENLPQMDFPPDAQERYRLRPGDLLVNEGGSYVGRSAIWRGELEECYYQKALHRLRPIYREKDTAEFLYYVMEAATRNDVFVIGGNQTTIDHLTAEQFRRYRFAFPPLETQRQIARFLDEKTARIDGLIEKKRALLDRLAEMRQALITRAVTKGLNSRRPDETLRHRLARRHPGALGDRKHPSLRTHEDRPHADPNRSGVLG